MAVNAVSPEAVDLLMRHSWPGNVRELANAVERAVILSRGGVLRPEVFQGTLDVALKPAALPPPSVTNQLGGTVAAVIPAPAGASDAFNLDELERQAIQRALVATAGNRTRAAKLLGISERTLRNKLNGRREEPATVED